MTRNNSSKSEREGEDKTVLIFVAKRHLYFQGLVAELRGHVADLPVGKYVRLERYLERKIDR